MGLYKGESFSEDEWKDKNINAATGKPFGQASEEAVQGKAQDWRDQGSPVPGTKNPEDIRSLGQQIIDWSGTPLGNAVISGLGLTAAAATAAGLSRRKTSPEAPKSEPYVAPSYDYETTAREVPERKGLPQPSTPAPQAATTPAPTAPSAPPTPVATPAATSPVATQQPRISGYGETNLNAPTGFAPPAAPAAPVEPKPMSELDQIKLETARVKLEEEKARAARNAELHQRKLEKEAKQAESNAKQAVEKQQKSGGGLSPMDKTLLNNQITAAAASDVKEQIAKKAAVPPATPAVPAPVAAPAPTPAPAPVAAAPVEPSTSAPTAKQASNIKEISLPSEWPKKGMNWLASAYGVEGAKNFIDTYNDGKPFKSHDEMKAVYDKVMVKPSFSTIPKTTRQDRGIMAAEREQFKIVPGAVAPPSGGGGGGGQMIRGGGGGATGIGRAGEEIHNLNPLKL